MHNNSNAGPIYTVSLAPAALTTAGAYDLMGVAANSSSRLEIVDVTFTIASTQFTSGSGLSLQLLRGTSATSTGASITPQNVKGHTGAPSAALTASGPSTTLTSTASAVSVYSDAFDGHGRFRYCPKSREERIGLTLGQRLFLRTTTPSIAVSVAGTITISETGKGLPS